MADNNVLKEFLVVLGWRNDETAMRKALGNVEGFRKGLLELAAVAAAASVAVTVALEKMAQGFERAYYASSRTGSSVKEINAFAYAVSQMGGTADGAIASLEQLGLKIRTNKGFRDLVLAAGRSGGVNIDTTHGIEKMYEGLGEALSRMNDNQARSFANALGIDEATLNAIRNYKELRKYQDEYYRKAKAAGVDLDAAAQDGKDLMVIFRSLYQSLALLAQEVGSKLFKTLGGPLKEFTDFVDANGGRVAEIIAKIALAVMQLFQHVADFLVSEDGTKFVDALTDPERWDKFLKQLGEVVGMVKTLFDVLVKVGGWLKTERDFENWIRDGVYGSLGFSGLTNIPGSPMAGDGSKPSMLGTAASKIWGGAKKLWNKATGGSSDADGAISGTQGQLNKAMVADYIRQSAIARGINPETALTVAGAEGLNKYDGDGRSSWGPFQLHYGGVNPAMPHAGLGDEFTKATGLDAKDPQTVRQQIDFALNHVRKHGWGAWSGAKAKRIYNFDGVGPLPESAKMPSIKNPLSGMHSGSLQQMFNAPIGGSTSTHSNDNSSNLTQHTTINISGVSDPNQVAAQIGAAQGRVHSTLLRNMQSAIG